MIGRWTAWKRFPNAFHGESLEAPIGPGVYEVCHTETGELVSFGSAANVAEALSKVLPSKDPRKWPFFRKNSRPRYDSSELEYRTCPAGTLIEARVAAEQLLGHRNAIWRRFSASRV
jgi:hypothetical protein